MSVIVGKCALCLQQKELQLSHLLPKALYRLVGSGSDPIHPDTVQITSSSRRKSSEQARKHLLCTACEQHFNENGEKWILRNCYRGRGRFRLRDELRKRNDWNSESDVEIYSATEEESMKIAYFNLSVIWRASVCQWPCRGHVYKGINLGNYQEGIRKFLFGDEEISHCITFITILSQLKTPVLAFSLPVSYRTDDRWCHRFHIPGFTFVTAIGKTPSPSWLEISTLRSPLKNIFIGTVGDHRAQKDMMRLMEKIAPPWAEYPLLNGVERKP